MSGATTDPPQQCRGPTLLEEFENSLPDFKRLNEEQHRKFVKAIRLVCRCFKISEARLRSDDFSKLTSTITRLEELYEEYHAKDTLLASAILFVKLHIESHYLDSQDANLVQTLTALHVYPRIPVDGAPDESPAV